jgi:GNAT superfamily N-acetyltransferase
MGLIGTIEMIPFDNALVQETAQAYLSIFSAPPWSTTTSLTEVLTQLHTDQTRDGFGGYLVSVERYGLKEIGGFAWWYDISGEELHELWRPRFEPKNSIPQLEGRGVYLSEWGVVPSMQNKGLGGKILGAVLESVEPDHDWIAVNSHRHAHAALALLRSHAFELLELKGVQSPERICLLKTVRH